MDLNALRHLQNAGMQQYLLMQQQQSQQQHPDDAGQQQQWAGAYARAAASSFAPVQLLGGASQTVGLPPFPCLCHRLHVRLAKFRQFFWLLLGLWEKK
jgi:hypothetical protein